MPAPPTPPGTLRLFLALWPGPAVRQALAAWLDTWSWPAGAVLIDPDRLHVTLHFLGHVASARFDELADAFALASAPFELDLGRGEVWPHGVAVLQADATPPELARLHADLADALRSLGLRTDARPFRPHVTLARHAAGAVPPSAGPGLRWAVHGHALVESRRVTPGSYRVLRNYPAQPLRPAPTITPTLTP